MEGNELVLKPDSSFIINECIKVQQRLESIDLSKPEFSGGFDVNLLSHLRETRVGSLVNSFITPHHVATQLMVFYNRTILDWNGGSNSLFLNYISAVYSLQSIKKFFRKRIGLGIRSPFGHNEWNSLDGPLDQAWSPGIHGANSDKLDQYLRKRKSLGKSPNTSTVYYHLVLDLIKNSGIKNFPQEFELGIEFGSVRSILTLAKVCVGIVNQGMAKSNNREMQMAEVNLLNYLCYLMQLKVPGKVEQEFSIAMLESIHKSTLDREIFYPSRKAWNDYGRMSSEKLPGHFSCGTFECFHTVDDDDFKVIQFELQGVLSEIYIMLAIAGEYLCPVEGMHADLGYEIDHENYIAANIIRLMGLNSSGGEINALLGPFLRATGINRSIKFR